MNQKWIKNKPIFRSCISIALVFLEKLARLILDEMCNLLVNMILVLNTNVVNQIAAQS